MSSQPRMTGMTFRDWLSRRATSYALLGAAAGIAFPVLASLIKAQQLHLPPVPANLIVVHFLDPVLWITDTAPFFLGFVASLVGRRQDEIAQANVELKQREEELNSIRGGLEMSVLERTRELDERNAQMRSVITLARQIADIQDLQTLLNTALDVVRERFVHYSANLYLLDETGNFALLSASTTAEGKAQAASGYRVSVGDQSVVGRVARRGKSLMVTARTETESVQRPVAATSAPTTQIALPLVVRGRVIGVLDMHPLTSAPVSQSESEILQLIADQLAASIESARLAGHSRSTVEQLEALTAEKTRSAWQRYLGGSSLAYQFSPVGVRPVQPGEARPAADAARIPLVLRGQQIGTIAVRRKAGAAMAPGEQDLAQKVAAQVALALDNIRLLEETRQRASQEQLISEISARFSRSLDVDALLQAAVREFAALPEVAEATVLVKPADESGLQSPN